MPRPPRPVGEDATLAGLQRERLRRHRIEPSKPITDDDAAAAFVRDRTIVMNTAGSSIAVMAWAIAGRALTGSWMAHPEAHRIYNMIGALGPPAFLPVRLIDGKYVTVTPDVAAIVRTYADDAERVRGAEAELTPDQAKLLAAVRAEGEMRMDRWPGTTAERNALRRALDRRLLVVTEEIHADRGGAHVAVVRPWAAGDVALAGPGASTEGFDGAVEALVQAALHSAVVAPVADVRRWFAHAGDGLSRLLGRGEAVEVERASAGAHVVLRRVLDSL
jgi:hypothetical protein